MAFPFSINKICGVALCFAVVINVSNGWAQLLQQDDKPDPPPKNVALEYPIGELESMTLDQLNAELQEVTVGFRKSLKAMWIAKTRYEHADKDESYGYGKTWREHATVGQKEYQKIKELSMEIYLKADKPTEEQLVMAYRMALGSASEGRVGIANRVLKKMEKLNPDNEDVWMAAGHVAVFSNDVALAERLLKAKPELIEDLPPEQLILFRGLEGFTKRWAKETAIREAEAEADDLPRVELMTSKGKIVIELFENEAPNTVANFISLVESGFYKNVLFHQVLRHFRSQVGLYFKNPQATNDAEKIIFATTNYQIADESKADNARKIFRGSIATVPGDKLLGTAQFSIYTAANPFASDEYPETVFGRVISGMDVVDILKVNARFRKDAAISEQVNMKDAMPDDYIVSAKVLRKRPNVDYQPKKLPTSKK